MADDNKIRVLIVDDHTIVRQGLKALLDMEKDIEVVGEAGTGKEAIEKSVGLRPSVVLMDISMPDSNGLQASAQIIHLLPDIKVIILSMTADRDLVAHALDIGIRGYLVKQTASSELLTAIREVEKGNAFFSPSVTKILLEIKIGHTLGPSLTSREREVLQLIADGKTNKEIADLLTISPKTVEKHRQQIMDKLNRHDVVSLVNYAREHGMVT